MFKTIAIIASLAFSMTAHAGEMFSECEEVEQMAVLAKDNTPFWSKEKVAHMYAKSCYEDIKEFIVVASEEDIQQFNEEYQDQIVIFSNDADFARFVVSKKESNQNFAVEATTGSKGLTPVIQPIVPKFFQSK
jgi:hypothetical protein